MPRRRRLMRSSAESEEFGRHEMTAHELTFFGAAAARCFRTGTRHSRVPENRSGKICEFEIVCEGAGVVGVLATKSRDAGNEEPSEGGDSKNDDARAMYVMGTKVQSPTAALCDKGLGARCARESKVQSRGRRARRDAPYQRMPPGTRAFPRGHQTSLPGRMKRRFCQTKPSLKLHNWPQQREL
jgi:hypothetical protein